MEQMNCVGTRSLILALQKGSSAGSNPKKATFPTEGLLSVSVRAQASAVCEKSEAEGHVQEEDDQVEEIEVDVTKSKEGKAKVKNKEDADSNETIHLAVCNGQDLFTLDLPACDVKVSQVDRNDLANHFLNDNSKHPHINIQFGYESAKALQLTIKQRVESTGARTVAYKGILKYQSRRQIASGCATNSRAASSTSASNSRTVMPNADNVTRGPSTPSMLSFMTTIGEALNNSQEQARLLESENALLRKKLNTWKDTAEKLSLQHWQNDRDQLLHNFLHVFEKAKKRSQSTIRELRDEVTRLQSTPGRALTHRNHAPDDLKPTAEPVPSAGTTASVKGVAIGNRSTKRKRKKLANDAGAPAVSDAMDDSMDTTILDSDGFASMKRSVVVKKKPTSTAKSKSKETPGSMKPPRKRQDDDSNGDSDLDDDELLAMVVRSSKLRKEKQQQRKENKKQGKKNDVAKSEQRKLIPDTRNSTSDTKATTATRPTATTPKTSRRSKLEALLDGDSSQSEAETGGHRQPNKSARSAAASTLSGMIDSDSDTE